MKRFTVSKIIIILIITLVSSTFGLSFTPKFIDRAMAKVDSPTFLTIDNFKNGETLRYDLPLLKGIAPGSQYIQMTSGGLNLKYSVNDGRWRGFFPLNVGENQLILSTSLGPQYTFNLNYQPLTNSKFVRLVYPMGSDSSGCFDAPDGVPNDISAAQHRIKLAGRILQSMSAELLYEKGQSRRTFQLVTDSSNNPVVDTPKVSLSVNQLRGMTGGDLWSYFYGQFSNLANRENIIDMAIMADSHFDPATGTLQAHTALGGGRLGLFGDSTLYSFPETLPEIESHFTDTTPIEPYLNPEYGRSREYWATYTTSLGAILHEMGHCFGLPHPDQPTSGDIMWRGFDYLNRLAVTYENGLGPIDPTIETMPRWTDQDVSILQSNPWFSLASKGDGNGGPQLIPGEMKVSTNQIVVMVEDSNPKLVSHPITIEINWPSVTWSAQGNNQDSLLITLDKYQGNSGDVLIIAFNTNGYPIGVYTNHVTITASDSSIQGSPLIIPIKLIVVDHVWQTSLPLVTR